MARAMPLSKRNQQMMCAEGLWLAFSLQDPGDPVILWRDYMTQALETHVLQTSFVIHGLLSCLNISRDRQCKICIRLVQVAMALNVSEWDNWCYAICCRKLDHPSLPFEDPG